MKILKKVEPKEPEKKKKCYNCKTVFSYTNADINSDRDGSYVVCPSCKKFIAVDFIVPKI